MVSISIVGPINLSIYKKLYFPYFPFSYSSPDQSPLTGYDYHAGNRIKINLICRLSIDLDKHNTRVPSSGDTCVRLRKFVVKLGFFFFFRGFSLRKTSMHYAYHLFLQFSLRKTSMHYAYITFSYNYVRCNVTKRDF